MPTPLSEEEAAATAAVAEAAKPEVARIGVQH
jgi:hypothetical protein